MLEFLCDEEKLSGSALPDAMTTWLSTTRMIGSTGHFNLPGVIHSLQELWTTYLWNPEENQIHLRETDLLLSATRYQLIKIVVYLVE